MMPASRLQMAAVSRKGVMTANGGSVSTSADAPARAKLPEPGRNAWPVAWVVNAQVIERERIRRGWTRPQLARAAHVDSRTVRSLVVGRHHSSLGSVQALCTALGLPLTDVIVFPERPGQTKRSDGQDAGMQRQDTATAERQGDEDLRQRRERERRAWARQSSYSFPGQLT